EDHLVFLVPALEAELVWRDAVHAAFFFVGHHLGALAAALAFRLFPVLRLHQPAAVKEIVRLIDRFLRFLCGRLLALDVLIDRPFGIERANVLVASGFRQIGARRHDEWRALAIIDRVLRQLQEADRAEKLRDFARPLLLRRSGRNHDRCKHRCERKELQKPQRKKEADRHLLLSYSWIPRELRPTAVTGYGPASARWRLFRGAGQKGIVQEADHPGNDGSVGDVKYIPAPFTPMQQGKVNDRAIKSAIQGVSERPTDQEPDRRRQ